MRGRAGLGAVIGICVGLALVGLLIFLPRARQGDAFYEVGDPLIVIGVPLLVIGIAVGAMLGFALDRQRGVAVVTRRSTRVFLFVGLGACALAVCLFLLGTGILALPR